MPASGGGAPSGVTEAVERRYCAYFHELDSWTEYWDIYHPETHGRFYFGDGTTEPGLLTLLLPRSRRPLVFTAWVRMALCQGSPEAFAAAVREAPTAEAVTEVDALLGRVFHRHFGDPVDPAVREDYLEAMFRFATNTLPPAIERDARIPDNDPRKPTAGHHALEGDLMWFAWSLVLEAAEMLADQNSQHARRALMLAGVATGCPADFTWRGHRRTRAHYARNDATVRLLREKGLLWANDFAASAEEIHALYRIREWGEA